MKNKIKMRKVKIWIAIIVTAVLAVSFKILDHYGSSDSKPEYPDYEMRDLNGEIDLLKIYEGVAKEKEMKEIFLQTGLGDAGIASVRTESKNFDEFLNVLEVYQSQLFCGSGTKKLVELKTGDVLVSMSQRFCFYPHGHAAIVVDGEKNILLEARSYRAGSCTCKASKWTKLSSIVILRLKDEVRKVFEKEQGYNPAESAANYAMNHLNGLKYSLFKDLRPLSGTTPEYTQCAHLVWYAYYACGLDIDENRGLIIKPKDFLKSDVFDVVQVFGINPKDILKLHGE